jgi:hypothetical protein
MGRKIWIFCVAVLTFAGAAASGAPEETPWRCLYGEWVDNNAGGVVFNLYELDITTGEGEALASFLNFHAWSAAANETWDTVVVAGFDLHAPERFVCYRLAGRASPQTAEEPLVILEFKGRRYPYGDVVFDAGQDAFYVGVEEVGTHANGEEYRETVLYRYDPAAGPPVELARLGRQVDLDGEVDEERIYVTYSGLTTYGRRRIYGYVDKNTFNVVPLGIFPDYFGGEPTRYVPYGDPEGAGQLLRAAPATVAGPRAYVYDTAQAEANDERTIYLRDAASPGGYREVKVNGTPGAIFYSLSRDAFVYIIYPQKPDEVLRIVVKHPDGTTAEEFSVSIVEGELADISKHFDCDVLYAK